MRYTKIDENARVLVEDSNYTLEWRVKSGLTPEGKKPINEFKWIVGGYFPTLETLLNDYVTNYPAHKHPEGIASLQAIVDCIREAEATIKKLIK